MSAIKLITHLFFPHESNNQKAKILHASSLSILALFLIAFQLFLSYIPKTIPSVLGYAANIKPSEVIRLTNEKRSQAGLPPLSENSSLSSAARAKGNDMLAKGYWAHFAPDGTSPWSFFLSFGYKYRYAGENLARDFSSDHLAVEAWMASPSHKENILSPNYKDIGIGVVEGSLSGADTTIIVQFFGAPLTTQPSLPVVNVEAPASTSAPIVAGNNAQLLTQNLPLPTEIDEPTPSPEPEQTASPTPTATDTPVPLPIAEVSQEPKVSSYVSPFQSTKNVSIAVVVILIVALVVDLIVVNRKKISRIGGRTVAHIGFFGMVFAVIMILKAGKII